MPIEPKEITSPKPKSTLPWVGIVGALGAASLANSDEPKWEAWGLIAFAAIIALAELYFRRRPRLRLVLDADGFALRGGHQKTLWRDIEGFSVMELPRLRFGDQLKVVTFTYGPGVKNHPAMLATINDFVAADACILMSWPRPHESIAEELNDYRRSALAARCHSPDEGSADAGTTGSE